MQLPKFTKKVYKQLERWIDTLVPQSVTPNMITIFGGLLNLVLLALFYFKKTDLNSFLWLFLFTQVFDIIDGAVARMRSRTSHLGGLLDNGVDMLSGVGLLVVYQLVVGRIDWFWVGAIAVLYMIRFWFVYRGQDVEMGGYKNALTIGLLCTYWLGLDPVIVVQLVAIFNTIVIAMNIRAVQVSKL